MKTTEQTRRELFEAWYRIEFPALELRAQNLIGTYTKYHADLSWLAWQASRAALCVELPDTYEIASDEEDGSFPWVAMSAGSVIKAIHAAGVKTK